jgi:hypothetical protein
MRIRSIVSGLVCAGLCVGVGGCLDTPLGNPQKSSIDPNVEGFYEMPDNKGTQVAELAPLDDHSYLLSLYHFKTDNDGVHVDGFAAMHAWLTNIKGVESITISDPDPMELFKPAAQRKANFVIGALTLKDQDLEIVPLDDDSFKDCKTPDTLEAAIADNIGKPAMYDPTAKQLWSKMTDQQQVQAVLKAANPP